MTTKSKLYMSAYTRLSKITQRSQNGSNHHCNKTKSKRKKRMLEQQMKMEHVKRDQPNSHHQAVRKLEKVRKQKD